MKKQFTVLTQFIYYPVMKEPETIRLILCSFRAFGFFPYSIRFDAGEYFHLKLNVRWYIYAIIFALMNLANVVQNALYPHWDIVNFHVAVTCTRLILVALDSLVCYVETLFHIRWHIDFFETIARLNSVLTKLSLKICSKRIRLWVKFFNLLTQQTELNNVRI